MGEAVALPPSIQRRNGRPRARPCFAVELAAYARGMREAGDGEAVPVGENLVVAAGLRPLVAPAKENSSRGVASCASSSSPSQPRESGASRFRMILPSQLPCGETS